LVKDIHNMRSLSLDQLTVLGVTPIDLVPLAAANGCGHVGIYFQSWSVMPPYDLRDPAQSAAMLSRCQEHGVRIAVAEPFLLQANTRLDELLPNLELAARLQVQAINAVVFDSDPARRTDTFGALCEHAAQFRLDTLIEFFPLSEVKSLQAATQLISDIGRPGVRINLDVLHLIRSGSTAADIAALDPSLIGHFQISDGPLVVEPTHMMTEASSERGLPGEGEFPLSEILAALPVGVTIGVEVPSLRRLQDGVTSAQWARTAVDATKTLMRGSTSPEA
jgi:sugar phosphate isomerase/epimerase